MVFLLQQKPHKNEANLLFLNTTKSYLLYIVKSIIVLSEIRRGKEAIFGIN